MNLLIARTRRRKNGTLSNEEEMGVTWILSSFKTIVENLIKFTYLDIKLKGTRVKALFTDRSSKLNSLLVIPRANKIVI